MYIESSPKGLHIVAQGKANSSIQRGFAPPWVNNHVENYPAEWQTTTSVGTQPRPKSPAARFGLGKPLVEHCDFCSADVCPNQLNPGQRSPRRPRPGLWYVALTGNAVKQFQSGKIGVSLSEHL